MTTNITLDNAHGTFTVSPAALDIAISRYLPASPAQLRKHLDDITGFEAGQYDDITTVSEALVMLADPIQGELDARASEKL